MDAPKQNQMAPCLPRVKTAWRSWLLAVVGLFVLMVAAFPTLLDPTTTVVATPHLRFDDHLYGLSPVGRQGLRYDSSGELGHEPWDREIFRQFRAGRLPTWQAGAGLGSPLLGNGQAAPLNPLKWLLLGPTEGYWHDFFVVGRLLIAGLATLLLAAKLGLSPPAAFFAASAFALSGPFLLQLTLANPHTDCILPLALLAAWRLAERPDWGRIAVLGLVLGLTSLLGHAESALFVAIAVTSVITYQVLFPVGDSAPPRRAIVGAWLSAGVLAAGLAMVAILPMLELMSLSTNYLAEKQAAGWIPVSLKWGLGHLANHLIAPVTDDPIFNVYTGLIPLGLAAWGLKRATVRRIALPLLAITLALLVVSAPAGIGAKWGYMPNAIYAMPLVTLAIALLGAAGFQYLKEKAEAAWGATRLGRRGLGVGMALVLLFVAGDLAHAARLQTLPLPPLDWQTPPPIVRRLQAEGPDARVTGGLTALLPNTPLLFGLNTLDNTEIFFLRRTEALLAAVNGGGRANQIQSALRPGFSPDLLDLLAVRFLCAATTPHADWLDQALLGSPARYPLVLEQAHARLYRNTTALPRARLLYQASFQATDRQIAATRLKGAPPLTWRNRALVETPDGNPLPGWNDHDRPVEPVRWLADHADAVEVQVSATAPALLVLADAFYPGWEATVDGEPVPIYPAYVAMRAVAIPAGDHRVAFTYRPASVAWGLAISTLSFLIALGLLLHAWHRKRGVTPLR